MRSSLLLVLVGVAVLMLFSAGATWILWWFSQAFPLAYTLFTVSLFGISIVAAVWRRWRGRHRRSR